jgi:hypothetical protein
VGDGLFCANTQDDENRTTAAARKNFLMTFPLCLGVRCFAYD